MHSWLPPVGSWNPVISVITPVHLSVLGPRLCVVDCVQGESCAMRKLIAVVFVAAMVMVAQAGASVVTSIPGGTVLPFPAVNYAGPGPQTVASGVTWSSTNDGSSAPASLFGYTGIYDFGTNGQWT